MFFFQKDSFKIFLGQKNGHKCFRAIEISHLETKFMTHSPYSLLGNQSLTEILKEAMHFNLSAYDKDCLVTQQYGENPV